MENKLLNYEQDAIIETLELIESAAQMMASINQEIKFGDVYDNVFRVLHSAKGMMGMIGHEQAAREIHELETIIVSLKNIQISELEQDIIVSILNGIIEYLEGKRAVFVSVKEMWKKNEARLNSNVVVVDENDEEESHDVVLCMPSIPVRLKHLLDSQSIRYIHCCNTNELYALKAKMFQAKSFLVSPVVGKVNCSLLFTIINNYMPLAKCGVVVCEQHNINMDDLYCEISFMVHGINSKNFENNILKMIEAA